MIFETPEDPQKGPWVRVTHHFFNFVVFRGGPGTPSGPRTETWRGPGGGPGGPFLVPERRFVIFAPPESLKPRFFIAKSLYWAPREIAWKRARVTEGSAGNQGVKGEPRGPPWGRPGGPGGAKGGQGVDPGSHDHHWPECRGPPGAPWGVWGVNPPFQKQQNQWVKLGI